VPILLVLWDRRGLLFQAVCIGCVVSSSIVLTLPKRFRSVTRLLPSAQVNSAAILSSRTVQDELITKLSLGEAYGCGQWEASRKQLKKNTTIFEDPANGIVTLSVTDRSPQRAAAIAQEYIDELNRLAIRLDAESALIYASFVKEQLTRVDEELRRAEVNLSTFSSSNGVIDPDDQIDTTIRTSTGLHQQLISEEADLQRLRTVYSDSSPALRSGHARINELRRKIEDVLGPGGKRDVTTSSEELRFPPSMREMSLLSTGYSDLDQIVEAKEAIVGALEVAYQSAQFAAANNLPVVIVLDSPEVPEKELGPPRAWIILSGLCCSFLLAAAWAVGAPHYRESLR
jgi:capsule polysaccharide export protein KpsE/RkpR